MTDARARFVEAMRSLVQEHENCDPDNCAKTSEDERRWRQAAEAFADAECGFIDENGQCEHVEGRIKQVISWRDHAACRAALLKEIGL